MRSFAKLVVDAEMAYAGGANPRDAHRAERLRGRRPARGVAALPPRDGLRRQEHAVISFLCKDALPGRGATFVSDSVAATDALLATEFGQKLKELGVCYVRNLTDRDAFAGQVEYGVYNHWQKSFETDDCRVAERRARDRRSGGRLGPEPAAEDPLLLPAFEYVPKLDRNVLYCSVADHGMWFDTWPLVQHLPYDERPLGHDLRRRQRHLPRRAPAVRRRVRPVRHPDRLAGRRRRVVDNYRFAHGRPASTSRTARRARSASSSASSTTASVSSPTSGDSRRRTAGLTFTQ